MKTTPNLLGGSVLAALSLISQPAWAAFYVGVGAVQVDIGDDFDGNSAVVGGGSAEILPSLDDGSGSKIMFGGDFGRGAFELSLTRSEHDGDWLGLDAPSDFCSLNFDYEHRFRLDTSLRPFLGIGLGIIGLTVEDGSTDGLRVEDAEYSGIDLRFAGGLQFLLHRRVPIDFQLTYRFGRYTSVDGVVDGDLDDSISGDGTTLSVELKYLFGDP